MCRNLKLQRMSVQCDCKSAKKSSLGALWMWTVCEECWQSPGALWGHKSLILYRSHDPRHLWDKRERMEGIKRRGLNDCVEADLGSETEDERAKREMWKECN